MPEPTGVALSDASPSRTVRQIPLPPECRSRSTLPRLDYTDTFLISTDRVKSRTATQWARLMFEAAPPYWRHALPWGWRTLGLEHGPADSADFVLGWPIRQCTDDHLLLGATGHRGLSAELLIERRPDGVLFATFVHQHKWPAKLEWAAIGAPHRRVVTNLLKHASRAAANS
jgi:hypothetical protein